MTKILIFSFLMVSILTAGEITKEIKAKPGDLLEVEITAGGSITIDSWDKDLVSVKVNYRGHELNEGSYVDIDETGHGVSISTGADRGSRENFDIKVTVPKKYDLDLSTMGGTLSVSGVNGDLKGETMGGDIRLASLNGKVKFTTMGGSIELRDSNVDGKVSTMGGKVVLDNVTGDVDGSSMGGNVIYRNVKSRDGKNAKGKTVTISTMGGDVNVDEALNGANVSTMGGDIHVNKAKDFVKANTMGGKIVIEDIDGWVKATTMGGDVDVTMTGNPDEGNRDVTISSMGGDIDLVLPNSISAEFDIRITYTRNSNQDYEIKSDFPLKIEESKDWIYNSGEPRKYIDGHGKTGNGKNFIKINTTNGDIRITKK